LKSRKKNNLKSLKKNNYRPTTKSSKIRKKGGMNKTKYLKSFETEGSKFNFFFAVFQDSKWFGSFNQDF